MIGLDGVSAQALSDVIGAVYDCALNPQLWAATCRKIADLCESTAGGICVHDMRHVQNDQLFVFGYEQTFLEKLGTNYAQTPMAAADVVADVGQVNALSMNDPDELLESRFYREVLQPYGLQDIIWFPALRTGARMASMHASRTEKAPRYQQLDVNLFKLLSPHVCRTLTISDALDLRTLRSEILEKTFDMLAVGVFLTSRDGRVVYMNEVAERQIKTGNAVRIVGNRIFPVDLAARAALAKAIDEASGIDADLSGQSLAIPDIDGAGYIATLLPVDRGQRSGILAPFAASVAVFMKDPAEAPMMPGEAFARLYKLTGGELRVLMTLAQGLGAKETADMLGIGEPTVRSHLQRIFSKTNTTRQADLLRLLQSSTPPLLSAQSAVG
ncbi:helix-turn-helix transcriptional regulator [Bradyrhizobium monzae]|uniref:helix-turn-helix transcriptional regulator n=1 Tax=Bradyrhizobium sp. Oc8 TaxID=2876780 RepID=UPI001F23327F